MIRLKLISKDMMPLVPGKIYQLEDISKHSKFVLIKMFELFGESAWGVADIVGGIRRCLKNYGSFYVKYIKLPAEQKKILNDLAQKPGQAVLVRELGEGFDLQREITSLVATSWLAGGAHKDEMAVFIPVEIAFLVNAIPQFLTYLEAEKNADGVVGEQEFSLFDDMIQLTSYIIVNPPKITNTGHLSKTSLKKLMPRLSRAANQNWEQLAGENFYPFCFNFLLRLCDYLDCVEIKTGPDGRKQFLKIDAWSWYLNAPPDEKMRVALLAYLDMLKEFPRSDVYLFTEKLLSGGGKPEANFLSPLKWRQTFEKNSVGDKYEICRHGEYYDGLFTYWVFEPLFYLGIIERTAVLLPTPWRRTETGGETSMRYLWRLTPLGVTLTGILQKAKEKSAPQPNRRHHDSRGDWLEKALATNQLFAGKLDDFFPPAVSRELVIQNDMTFFVPQNAPPALIWLLHVFGEVEQTGYIVGGRFTKESIIKALKTGLDINNLTTFIKNESKTETSPTVLRVIDDWSASYNRAIFAHVTVVMCDTPELAAELAANAKLSQSVLGKLGPQAVFIRHEDEKAVRQWLEKKGRVPLPGVYGCESLAKWVGEYAK